MTANLEHFAKRDGGRMSTVISALNGPYVSITRFTVEALSTLKEQEFLKKFHNKNP